MATFFLTPGDDNFTGISGEDNTFVLDSSTLQSTDIITGAIGAFTDVISVINGGAITAAQFVNVTNCEWIVLSDGKNYNITLTNGLVAGSSVGYFTVYDGTGDNTVDASGVSNGVGIAFFANSGADTFKGGNGNDEFFFAPGDLTSADTVAGGAGFDRLSIITAGTVAAPAFALVSEIEALALAGGNYNVTLTNGLIAGSSVGYFTVYDGPGNDTVDASGVTNGIGIAFFADSGNDTFKGGNGNDEFFFAPGDLTSGDTVTGGAGFDILTFGSAGTVAASAFANVSGIEELTLAGGNHNVTLTNGLVAGSECAGRPARSKWCKSTTMKE